MVCSLELELLVVVVANVCEQNEEDRVFYPGSADRNARKRFRAQKIENRAQQFRAKSRSGKDIDIDIDTDSSNRERPANNTDSM